MDFRARQNWPAAPALCGMVAVALLLGGCLERELKPLNPCLVSGVTAKISVTNIDKVDMLFMVDNSGSMEEEQAQLRDQFPYLVRVLASGNRENGPPDVDFPPAKNMHLGVVSSDLGLVGIQGIDLCMDLGDEARLQNTATADPAVQGCNPAGYPKFLSFNVMSDDPAQTAIDFSCISTLGTMGCGFEQQLESTLKALWPANDQRILFLRNPTTMFGEFGQGGDPGSGGENAGFLRNNALEGLSLIAIIMVSDEEDCSSMNLGHFRPPQYLNPMVPADQQLAMQGLNVRCHFNPQNLYKTSRYIEGFQQLRAGNEQLVIFAALVGVPPETVSTIPETFADDPAVRTAFYSGIRNHALMQPKVLSMNTPDPQDDEMRPSCDTTNGVAYPPLRILEVAEGFGGNGIVQSICQDDFGPAIDAIIAIIARQLGAVCLPRPLVRNASGVVGCNVIWELPHPSRPVAGTPLDCSGLPFLLPVNENEGEEPRTGDGAARCRVAQLAVDVLAEATMPTRNDTNQNGMLDDGDAVFDAGWYYDDFSTEVENECTSNPKQRVAFTNGAMPPTGVTVKLECLNETQSLADYRPNLVNDMQPTIGTPCAMSEDNSGCAVALSDGTTDERLFCHAELNVCVQGCEAEADCPPAWVCDDRATVKDKLGNDRFYCVNPTCGS